MTRNRNTKLQNPQPQHNLDRALGELHRVKRQAKLLKLQNRKLRQSKGKSSRQLKLIPRPPGQNGKDGWILREKMSLSGSEKDKLLYNSIRSGIRTCMDTAGLNMSKTFKGQETGRLYQCYTLAKERYPYLRRFENDWATREIVKDVLINRRKYVVKLAGIEENDKNDENDENDENAANSLSGDENDDDDGSDDMDGSNEDDTDELNDDDFGDGADGDSDATSDAETGENSSGTDLDSD